MSVSMDKKVAYFSTITVHRASHGQSKGILSAGNRQFPCALGRKGITAGGFEGDGATPAGVYQFLQAWYRPDREALRPTGLPIKRIAPNSGWCDAPSNPNYNRAIKRPYPASHEIMHREDQLYNWCLVFDHNYTKRMRNLGSAVFFHVARENFAPTEGCIAIQPNDMRWLVGHIGLNTRLIIRA
jgi:L,D-peptidoglycan transpeptidase YkuD (ErfK/YbiS/YcfS/YnhG family)